MKQVVQNPRRGAVELWEVPAPALRPEGVLVRSLVSLISAGTERAALKLGQRSLAGKALERPDLVRRVIDKLGRDGFWPTLQAVAAKLDRLTPLGYSVSGTVRAVGARVHDLRVEQRVACAGAGHANHAEVNYVPRLLAAPIPGNVSDEQAAYATVGAIALQGVRNADVRIGDSVLVIGLGLIGQLTLQLLRGAGCRVAAIEPQQYRHELALESGSELVETPEREAESRLLDWTRGRGFDAVLITAATRSNAPVETAARLARDRARIVVVGVAGMQVPRAEFYGKELSLIVSRSYGPGRYDPSYEVSGHDYPIGHVRWTENRNLEAFLDLVASGQVRPELCTTHRFPITQAGEAFELILAGRERHLGVVLTYPTSSSDNPAVAERIVLRPRKVTKPNGTVGVSLIGAGQFAQSVILPALHRRGDVRLRGVVSASGLSARMAGTRFHFDYCGGDLDAVLADAETDLVIIATRHSSHAELAARALESGKAVLVEKPLAISLVQLRRLLQTAETCPGRLMVGFNRRFAPATRAVEPHVTGRGPMLIHYRCNAGRLPADHWLTNPDEGGRIVGEACHFFDLFSYLTDSEPREVHCTGNSDEDVQIAVRYGDGSTGHLLYTSQGPSALGKERVEVVAGGAAAVVTDFHRVEFGGSGSGWKRKRIRKDKGHGRLLAATIDNVANGRPMPIDLASLVQSTLTSLAALESLRTGQPVEIRALEARLREAA